VNIISPYSRRGFLDMQNLLTETKYENRDFEGNERLGREIEAFEDPGSYLELMARPYTRRLKAEVDAFMSTIKLKGARILELGCGVSEHAHFFNKDNEVILTDINMNLLEKNEPPSRLMFCDAQDLSAFDDDSIDFVIYVGVLHHLVDQAIALREAGRVLKPGGRVFICEPHRKSLNYIYYLFRLLAIRIFGIRVVRKMIGCVSAEERQLDCEAVESVFSGRYKIAKWTILSFRLPPLRIFRRSRIDVMFSRIFDALPLFRSIGTTILYDIQCLERPEMGKGKPRAPQEYAWPRKAKTGKDKVSTGA
jgi:SAM-dependent methyltransferase